MENMDLLMDNCNLCGYREYRIVYSKKDGAISANQPSYTITQELTGCPFDIVECSRCGLRYSLASKEKSFFRDEYVQMKDELYSEEEPGRRKTARKVLSGIDRFKNTGRLLEIGSACGFFLDEAKKSGWEATGIEPSRWAASYARENFNLNIIENFVETIDLPRQSFDVVVIIDVLEHLAAPSEALKKIRNFLKDDGILYIATPDIASLASKVFRSRWWGIKRHHLYYFNRKTITALLEGAGFKVITMGFYGRYFSASYISSLMSNCSNFFAGIVNIASRFLSLDGKVIPVNAYDQIAVYARKKRLIDDISDSSEKPHKSVTELKTIIVLPAYNAARTLKRTVSDIPKDMAGDIILVDDDSSDNTVEIAKGMGLKVFKHDKNLGYGANQKTCYEEALRLGADIVVMLHPDYQYDPKVIPALIEPIEKNQADAVFGSRMMKGGALQGGMPRWKHNANILLTALENVALNTYLTEYHSGFRAYSRGLLESINFKLNSNNFIFDTEIIIQALLKGFKIEEIPIKTRYFDEASTIGFFKSCLYGLGILKTLFKYTLHSRGIIRFKQFNQGEKEKGDRLLF